MARALSKTQNVNPLHFDQIIKLYSHLEKVNCLSQYINNIHYYSQHNEVKINQNCKETNTSNNIESNTFEHRLNSWLVSVEDILSSFNLKEGQKNTLKILLKK